MAKAGGRKFVKKGATAKKAKKRKAGGKKMPRTGY